MSVVMGVHDPAELARYGLPPGVWAWVIEADSNELVAKGVDGALYAVTVVGIDSWSADLDPSVSVQHPDARLAQLPGLVRMDIRYLSVRVIGTSAELVWKAPPAVPPRLDLLRVEDLSQSQVVQLFRARRLVGLDWGPALGRPLGDTALTALEFDERLRETLANLRRMNLQPRQVVVAEEIGIDTTTLRKYLKRADVSWRSITSGSWPPS